MAEVTVNYVPQPQKIESVTLTLTPEEAQVLNRVLGDAPGGDDSYPLYVKFSDALEAVGLA